MYQLVVLAASLGTVTRAWSSNTLKASSTFAIRPLIGSPIALWASSLNNDETGDDDNNQDVVVDAEVLEQQEVVGNLVADDEWAGIAMELSEIVQKAVAEDLKKNARDFLGKDDYKLGDMSKEIDARVKQGVAELRGKEEYEVGDLVLTLDEMSKSMTEDLTGKPYEFGDLSKEIDKRVKSAVATYVGKPKYETGDLSRAVAANVKKTVSCCTPVRLWNFWNASDNLCLIF